MPEMRHHTGAVRCLSLIHISPLLDFGFVPSIIEQRCAAIYDEQDLCRMLAFDVLPYCVDVYKRQDDTTVIFSDYAFLYSSFELQARGNINVHSEDIIKVTKGVSKISINAITKIFRKDTEMILIKDKLNSPVLDAITVTESHANTYIVPDNSSYFLFNRLGVKPLSPVSYTHLL